MKTKPESRVIKSIAAVILAAGEGKRLNYSEGKPLAPVLGKTLIDFSLCEFQKFVKNEAIEGKVCIVVGHKKEKVIQHINDNYSDLKIDFAVQEKQLGTADAIRSFVDSVSWAHQVDAVLVLCADTPLIRASEFSVLLKSLNEGNLDAVAASFVAENPRGYGRIIRSKAGFHIVEEKDSSVEEKLVKEVNSGLYILRRPFLVEQLGKINSNNKANEFYLTDVFKDHFEVKPILFDQGHKFLGVNDWNQLEEAQSYLLKEKIQFFRQSGVRIIDSKSFYCDYEVSIGKDTIVYPNVHLMGNTSIACSCVLEMGTVIKNCKIMDLVKINAYSYLEDSIVREEAAIGPFARIRPGSDIGRYSKIGNFVETKKALLHEDVKVSHLSYVGDAEIGKGSNIGCGFITCNYDGVNKNKTVIGEGTFIGSDCQMIAPINIGKNAYIAAGSTINKDVPDDGFAIARQQQTIKEGLAKRFLKKKGD